MFSWVLIYRCHLQKKSGAGGHEPSGINFDRYEDIPVEATGSDVPAPIEDVSTYTKLQLTTIIFQ